MNLFLERQFSHVHKVAKEYMTRLFEEFNDNSFYKDQVVIRSILPTAGIFFLISGTWNPLSGLYELGFCFVFYCYLSLFKRRNL